MALLAGAWMCAAAPVTLYKGSDLENARENVRRHAWAKRVVDGWRRSSARILSCDRATIDSMIGELTPWTTYGNNCPVCVGKKSSMGEVGLYRWSVDRPDEVSCKYCGTVYPHPDYPETGRLECTRMGQTFTYYETAEERAHPEDRSGRYAYRWASWPVHTSWSGLIRYYRANWCIRQVPTLAKLYALTGELAYAERCIWVMDRLARVYPGWLYHSYNGTFADCPPAEAAREMGRHPRAGRFPKDVIINPCGLHQEKDYAYLNAGFWGAGRFGTGTEECSTILDVTVAYDLIRGARRPDGTPLLDAATEKRLVEDLILAGCADRENWAEINNKAGPNRALSAAVGILFGRPEGARRALEGFERLLAECFHSDGFCRESPSYSSMHLSLMADIPIVLRGYSDPAGYTPAQGKRFDDFNPFQHVERYRLALESMVRMTAPSRRPPVLGDTHWQSGLSAYHAEVLTYWYDRDYAPLLQRVLGAPLEETGGEYALWFRPADLEATTEAALPLHTEWFPDWRVGVLRGPDPQGSMALYLNGYGHHGHRHDDTLGLILYSFGQERVSDRGYIWDDPRNAWTKSTESHNLVVVDGQNQGRKGREARLLLFGSTPMAQVIEAEAKAYEQCDLYRRACVLVPLAGEACYVLDVFRVRGGRRHSYGLQCNGTLAGVTGVDLAPLERQHPWLKAFRSGVPAGPWQATWSEDAVETTLHLLSPGDRAVVADAPGWRSCKGTDLNAAPIQQAFLEREAAGEGPLESCFVAVIASRQAGGKPLQSVRLLPSEPAGSVAVEVVSDAGTDVLLMSPDGTPCRSGDVALEGRFGMVRRPADGPPSLALVDGVRLTAGSAVLSLDQAPAAEAVSAVEGWTMVLLRAPGAGWQPGAWVLAGDTAYQIEAVEGPRVRVRDYPVGACHEARVMPVASVIGERP